VFRKEVVGGNKKRKKKKREKEKASDPSPLPRFEEFEGKGKKENFHGLAFY